MDFYTGRFTDSVCIPAGTFPPEGYVLAGMGAAPDGDYMLEQWVCPVDNPPELCQRCYGTGTAYGRSPQPGVPDCSVCQGQGYFFF